MLRSMTGYGRAVKGGCSVDIQSVNKRHLEIRGPIEVRKWVSDRIKRGQVSVSVTSLPSLKEAGRMAHEMAKELDLDPNVCFEVALKGARTLEGPIEELVKEALDHLIEMKEAEGRAIQKDMEVRLQTISKLVDEIEGLSGGATERFRKKLEERLKDLTDDERVLREVAIYAEKVDITEEIVRMQHHLTQFPKYDEGKRLEFILQEMNREANTIASKASDAVVIDKVIEIKSELEKMREQVQNVE